MKTNYEKLMKINYEKLLIFYLPFTLEQCGKMHLFREGTFYRAYEWRAWLCVRYFAELKVTHRMLKGGEWGALC